MSPRVTVWPTCMESRKAWPLFLSPYFFMYTHCPQLIASPCPFHQSSSHARYFPSMIRFTLSCRRLFHCLPHPFQFTTHSFLIQPPPDIASGIPLPPFHPDASHPEAARRYSIRTSRTRKPSTAIPSEHLAPRSPSVAIPSGHLAPGSPPPSFHSNILRIWNPSPRCSTFSGYLASRILSGQCSIFPGYLALGIPFCDSF